MFWNMYFIYRRKYNMFQIVLALLQKYLCNRKSIDAMSPLYICIYIYRGASEESIAVLRRTSIGKHRWLFMERNLQKIFSWLTDCKYFYLNTLHKIHKFLLINSLQSLLLTVFLIIWFSTLIMISIFLFLFRDTEVYM